MRVFVLIAALAGCGVEPNVTCENNDACFAGYSCDSESGVCLRACTVATETDDCLVSQLCDVAVGATEGVCRQSESVVRNPIRTP